MKAIVIFFALAMFPFTVHAQCHDSKNSSRKDWAEASASVAAFARVHGITEDDYYQLVGDGDQGKVIAMLLAIRDCGGTIPDAIQSLWNVHLRTQQ